MPENGYWGPETRSNKYYEVHAAECFVCMYYTDGVNPLLTVDAENTQTIIAKVYIFG